MTKCDYCNRTDNVTTMICGKRVSYCPEHKADAYEKLGYARSWINSFVKPKEFKMSKEVLKINR